MKDRMNLSALDLCHFGIWMMLNMKLHFPLYDLQEIVLVYFFPTITFYSERKREENLTNKTNAKQLLSNRNGRAQPVLKKKGQKMGKNVLRFAQTPF